METRKKIATLLLFNNIRNRIKTISKDHPKFYSVFILLCANVFNNLFTFVANLIFAKKFGPEYFGIFSLAISVMMIAYMIADMGFNLTMVRYFNLHAKDPKQQQQLLSSLLLLRLLLIIAFFLLAPLIGIQLIHGFKLSHAHVFLFSLAIASGGILSLWMYLQNFMQAHKQFAKLATYLFLYGVFRIACFGITYVALSKQLTADIAVGTLYTLPVVIIILIGLLPIIHYLFARGFPSVITASKIIKQALKYSKWVAISGICYGFLYRFVQVILATLSTQQELGILSAGFIFTVAFTTLNVAIKTVFFPYITGLSKIHDIGKHFSRLKKVLPYYILLVIVGIAFLSLIQLLFLDERYRHALPVFWISSAGLASTVFLGLISMLLHTLMRPEIDASVNIVRLIAVGILAYFLVPIWGAIGGAISYTAVLLLGEIYLILQVKYLLHKKYRNEIQNINSTN